MEQKQKRSIIILLLVVGSLTVLYFYLTTQGQLHMFSSVEAFRAWVGNFGLAAPLVFALVQVLSVIAAPIPNNIITLAGGAMFGVWGSFFISTAAITAGSCIAFALSRGFGKPLVSKLVSPKIMDKYEGVSAARQDMFLALALLLPFFPDDAICFMAGLGKIRFYRFFVISLLTRPWGLIAASFLGSGNAVVPIWGWVIIVLITALIFVFGVKYGSRLEDALIKKFKRNHGTENHIHPQ